MSVTERIVCVCVYTYIFVT